jgi:hypothetical protein
MTAPEHWRRAADALAPDGALDRAVRGIQSARYLVHLGCPKPMGRHTVLDPMEQP